uniref:uncharacterized protein LOC131103375 isoform X3 n=1 Tax=Doryrhamphus excisus TaxID=161450 RepID=UPI0025ADECB6|nr:uncharacterized protein LOC131103375 isoform X3 [Doryrhamphus excisus]
MSSFSCCQLWLESVSMVASPESQLSSLGSSDSLDTIILSDSPSRKCQRLDSEAMQLVKSILTKKSGGEYIINEYIRTKTLADESRTKMVNILAADMTEKNGTSPPRQVKEMYARGIVNLFPYLRDPFSKNGYHQRKDHLVRTCQEDQLSDKFPNSFQRLS